MPQPDLDSPAPIDAAPTVSTADAASTARRLTAARRDVGGSWGRVQPERWAALAGLEPGSLLDVGCAGGAYVRRWRAEGRAAVGIDLLRDAAWPGGGWFGQAECTALPFADGSFDHVCAFEVVEHIPNPEWALRELARVARATIVLSVPNCETPAALRRSGLTFHHWVDRSHVNFFDAAGLSEMLAAEGLAIVDMRGINAVSPERLLLAAWGVPDRPAAAIARRLAQLPGRRPFPMTLLVVARVVQPGRGAEGGGDVIAAVGGGQVPAAEHSG